MPNHSPLISCIIIFLNEERFLADAIDSILAQTYQHWELLLVDDGSTDQSSKIAQSYVEKYPEKIRYLDHPQHENRGMSASRNLGVSQALGKYISYLDGDDLWLPNKLERQLEILTSQPEAVMVYGPLLCWYSWTGEPKDQERDFLYGLGADGVLLEANRLIEPPQLVSLFLRYSSLIPSGVLIEKQIIEKVGGSEEIFRGSYEDAVVHTKVCLISKVYVSSECWYKYRMHPQSWQRLAIKQGKAATNHLFFLNWVKEYLSQQGVTDPEVWQALKDGFWPYEHPRLHLLIKGYHRLINGIETTLVSLGRKIMPTSLRQWLWEKWASYRYRSLN
ncbi:MAG: glycosyltransferase family 2 protein [Microcoleaceae cyanobacterium]